MPIFKEVKDMKEAIIPEETPKAMVDFRDALESARDILRFGSEGNKIYIVCP